jgi:putative Mg2+ transporter-C (MgtC) family protein
MWDLDLHFLNVVLRLGLAIGFGAAIGYERQRRHKPAGMRTLMLVALGAAMFVLVIEEVLASATDPPRLPMLATVMAAVIGGIGFIGAGAIMRDSGRVGGVTTAAAIWVTAGIGIACGVGELALAVICGAATLLTLALGRVADRGGSTPPDPDA